MGAWRASAKAFFFGFVVFGTSACYVARAALHHNDLFNSRRPVSEALADPALSEKTRQGLETAQRVLAYAKEQGLNTDGAYEYFVQTDRPYVSYLVQAAEPDQVKFVTWWFPVVGRVPYLGFFDQEERDQKAKDLEVDGYDVTTGAAGAFSSLGWFADPIFTSMVTRTEADVAHLFLHELTHRTLWVPGSVQFNENLAEYAAGVMTVDYMRRVGKAKEIERYEAKREDKRLFRDWLQELRAELETLYRNDSGLSRKELLQVKKETFARYQKPPLKPAFKVVDYVEGEEWNNASVLGAGLYAPDVERFARAHQCVGDARITRFLTALDTQVRAHPGEPFAALDGLCNKATRLTRPFPTNPDLTIKRRGAG